MLVATVTSCKEDTSSVTNYDNWESRNTAYFSQKFREAQDSVAAGKTNWKLLKSVYKAANSNAETDYVIAHIIQCSHDEETPVTLATDSVYMHYRGRLIPRDQYVQDTTTYAKEGVMFDTSYYGETLDLNTAIPAKFAMKDLVDGLQTALANMHAGDRVEVIVPYTMGYGTTSSNSSIPAYSTLRFDVMLVYIGHPGKKMPKVQ
jgi:FKBP-type peptidyl-prolyl cis-trans isomerase FklB